MNSSNLMPKIKAVVPSLIWCVAIMLTLSPSNLSAQFKFRFSNPFKRNVNKRNSEVNQQGYQSQQVAQRQNGYSNSQTAQSKKYPVQQSVYQSATQTLSSPRGNAMRLNDQSYDQQYTQQNQLANSSSSVDGMPINAQLTSLRSDLPPRQTGMFERSQAIREQKKNGSRASKVGDLLTVDVIIDTVVNNQDQRQYRKSTGADGTANASATGAESLDINYESSSNRQLVGQTALRENRAMTDAFQTRVVDVRNNVLIIQGERYVTVQGDLRKLVLSGQIDRRDISVGNRISSDLIYGMRMEYEGVGPEQDYVRQGWLKRQISKAWPF